jgi:hypothetical protein
MVRKSSVEDGGESANDAARVRVVFAGARDPLSSLLNADLTRNMVVPEGPGRHNRYRAMLMRLTRLGRMWFTELAMPWSLGGKQ